MAKNLHITTRFELLFNGKKYRFSPVDFKTTDLISKEMIRNYNLRSYRYG